MSKTDIKFYICIHDGCAFETAKRKAIYTHLVRTHSERKEDYECEYCSIVFEDEALVEDHLNSRHPDKQFTYTCVSRIESIISRCAKLGAEGNCDEAVNDGVKNETEIDTDGGLIKSVGQTESKSSSFSRTKASVNESLNNLAARNQNAQSSKPVVNSNSNSMNSSVECVSQPGSLKVKLNLKKIAECSNREIRERSSSPPKLEPESPRSDGYLDSVAGSPPDIIPSQGPDGISVREKASKYFDRLEVYHTTDKDGRRCCPFCDYKTGKNTIRVHLSGIHKIYFVKCSLCEYKAAFPHQVTQHGIKFHKTTNLNVIQLSKESRERRIAQLQKSVKIDPTRDMHESYNYSVSSHSTENSMDTDMYEDDNFSDGSGAILDEDKQEPEMSEQNYIKQEMVDENMSSDTLNMNKKLNIIERSYPPPKSQMAKTDYFTIRVIDGVHLYCCNFCEFTTQVRATIYTHKYRHEDDSYKCGYCDFTASPRSNVVNHLRSRHKNKTVLVTLVGQVDDDGAGIKEPKQDGVIIKQEEQTVSKFMEIMEPNTNPENIEKPTIINVPQYKRTLTSAFNEDQVGQENQSKRKKPESDNYKLSLNKMYKVNPTGASPKYVCVECSYACDTHPKMKHHLYRHRPQQYKCPYCDHRKYPRSYVVRHVRDTHRDKPVRVIDLSKGTEPIDIPEYMDEHDEESAGVNEQNQTMDESNDGEIATEKPDEIKPSLHNEKIEFENLNGNTIDPVIQTKESHRVNTSLEPQDTCSDTDDTMNDDILADSLKSTQSIIENLNQSTPLKTDFLDDSNDVNPNFSEAVYTSTPLIESLINGNFEESDVTPEEKSAPAQKTPMFKKKSSKDYRINYGDGARYICNICNYQTENYKTIHNHMYRHDSQKYQCPYCGYRRSPRSFVENHIREVHRGQPIFVTELKEELEDKVPMGSPRQCIMSQKKKELSGSNIQEKDELNLPNPSKLQIKWPAPKPASQVNMLNNTSPLQVPVLQKAPNAVVVPKVPFKNSAPGISGNQFTNGSNPLSASVMPPNVTPFKTNNANVGRQSGGSFTNGNLSNGNQYLPIQSPFKFKEPSRTTFKTMYKCVFDPETCNHISKDKSKMKQHLFMHVEYKPWSCDFCEMTTSQSSHIRNHVRAEHPGESDMSFKYKKHNYLEKHIDTFLTKGLFTVPVNEYRMIMDLKGNTKKTYQTVYKRDADGYVMCPHCDYKTKTVSMRDHVKMKHMQPRFKCHWCDYKAFYRSEIRRHHKKERTHMKREFKVQELDLKEVAEGLSGGKPKEEIAVHGDQQIEQTDLTNLNIGMQDTAEDDPEDDEYDDDDDDDDDDNDDASSSEDLSMFMDYSTGEMDQSVEANTNVFDENLIPNETASKTLDSEGGNILHLNSTYENKNVPPEFDNTLPVEDKAEIDALDVKSTNAKFKCGYCSFSAALRVKVKMHCSKKHPNKDLYVIEPFIRYQSDTTVHNDGVMQVSCAELKGTKFEADLKRVGVAKLNLTSLFPQSYNQKNHKRKQVEEEHEGKDSSDNIMKHYNTNGILPIKKTEKSSKLDMLIMKLSKNKNATDTDSHFKRPKDPVRPSIYIDRRKERKPSPAVTKESMASNSVNVVQKEDFGVESVADQESDVGKFENNVDSDVKDIIIEPLPGATQEQLINPNPETSISKAEEKVNGLIISDTFSLAKQDTEFSPIIADGSKFRDNSSTFDDDKPNLTNTTATDSANHNSDLEIDVDPKTADVDINDSPDIVTDLVGKTVDNNQGYLQGSFIDTDKVNLEKLDTELVDTETPLEDSNDVNIKDALKTKRKESVIQKTLPNGSPVILEMDTDENDQTNDGADINGLHEVLCVQTSA